VANTQDLEELIALKIYTEDVILRFADRAS
jgi:hypothetical protein